MQALFDYLEAGQPLSEFLDDFPTVAPSNRRDALHSLMPRVAAHLDALRPGEVIRIPA